LLSIRIDEGEAAGFEVLGSVRVRAADPVGAQGACTAARSGRAHHPGVLLDARVVRSTYL